MVPWRGEEGPADGSEKEDEGMWKMVAADVERRGMDRVGLEIF